MSRSIPASSAARVLLGVLLLALAAGASAQRIYRSVGPDGKAVFSDRPPADRDAVELRAGRTPAPAASATDKSAAGQPASPSTDALTRSLTVMVNVDSLVTGFVQICGSTLPSSMKKYSDAADRWRERHRTLLQRRDLILSQTLSQAQVKQVRQDGHADARRAMDAVYRNPVAESRIRWCDATAEEIVDGKLDRHKDPAVSGPLLAYQAGGR